MTVLMKACLNLEHSRRLTVGRQWFQHSLVEKPNVIPRSLVDGNRVRRRGHLRIAPGKDLRPTLHNLQVQTTRKPIAPIVRKQVLEEQILHHRD